jgi:hypothetical protein
MNKDIIRKLLTAVILFGIPCNLLKAMWAIPPIVPVNRLVANATAYVKENPTDANGYYVLGRIYYLAFSNKTVQFYAQDKSVNVLPEIPKNYILNSLNMNKVKLDNRAYRLNMRELGYSRTGVLGRAEVPEIPEDAKGKFIEVYEKKIKEFQWQMRRRTLQSPDPNPA